MKTNYPISCILRRYIIVTATEKNLDLTMRYKRGSIFLTDLGYQTGNIQGKKRPCIIVSNDNANQHAPILTVIPLTTKLKKSLPCHLEFYHNGIWQTALVEQITTVMKTQCSEFLGFVDARTMILLDYVIKCQLSLSLNFDASSFEMICKNYINNVEAQSQTESRAESQAQLQAQPQLQQCCESSQKKKRREWTADLRYTFLSDYESLSAEEIAEKYNISKASVYTYASMFRRL